MRTASRGRTQSSSGSATTCNSHRECCYKPLKSSPSVPKHPYSMERINLTMLNNVGDCFNLQRCRNRPDQSVRPLLVLYMVATIFVSEKGARKTPAPRKCKNAENAKCRARNAQAHPGQTNRSPLRTPTHDRSTAVNHLEGDRYSGTGRLWHRKAPWYFYRTCRSVDASEGAMLSLGRVAMLEVLLFSDDKIEHERDPVFASPRRHT